MPFRYHLDPAQHLVLGTAKGVLTNAEIRNYHRTLRADARFHPSMDQLMNCIHVRRMRISAETLHHLARHSPFGAGSRRAIVVPSGEAFTYARLFRALSDAKRSDVEIFFDIPSALQFLGRDKLIAVDEGNPKIIPTERAMFRRV